MSQDKLEKIIQQIRDLPDHFYLDGVIEAQVKFADVETTLLAATMCARVDIIHYLVENFRANVLQTHTVSSDRHSGQTNKINLLETALVSFLTRPDADKTKSGQINLLETVKYFVAKYVPSLPNPHDPLEGSFLWAHFLANPELANDKKHPYFYLVPQCTNEALPEKFTAIYDYMKWVRGIDAGVFEKALEEEVSKLKSQFHATQRLEEYPDDQGLRPIGEILKGLDPQI